MNLMREYEHSQGDVLLFAHNNCMYQHNYFTYNGTVRVLENCQILFTGKCNIQHKNILLPLLELAAQVTVTTSMRPPVLETVRSTVQGCVPSSKLWPFETNSGWIEDNKSTVNKQIILTKYITFFALKLLWSIEPQSASGTSSLQTAKRCKNVLIFSIQYLLMSFHILLKLSFMIFFTNGHMLYIVA